MGLLLAAAVGPAVGQAPPAITVKDVAVEGHRRIQEAVILGRVKTTPGSTFIPSVLSDDVRSIFNLGFFDDVQARVDDFEGGVRITFVVSERPFIRDLDFTGNSRATGPELQDKIDVRLGTVYNPAAVERSRQKLKDWYEDEGYFEAEITPRVERFADGDVRVVFEIVEGRKITIDRIAFKGNQGLNDRQLKAALVTKERTFFIIRGTVQRQRIEQDIEAIIGLYNDHGYTQARVESHDVAVDRERARVTLTFTVVEGPQYRVGEIGVRGATSLPESEIRRVITLKSGRVFSRSELRESLRNIGDLYSTIGRAAAEITPRTETTDRGINVTFEIAEGPEVYVERINITGNVRSQDKILRRELPLVEGELFTLQKLQRARQRLVNLGYFETVNLTTTPGTDRTRIVVNVEVTERPTGLFSIGGGFSSVDSFVGTLDLSQNNFLGRGWLATLRLRVGERTQQGIISFTEPWLFDRPLSAGFDLFSTEREYTEYDYLTTGVGLRLSHPFADYWRVFAGYRFSRDEIDDVSEFSSSLLQDEIGTSFTSLVALSLSRDSRDNATVPTRGGHTSVVLDLAGLGGDNRYVKVVASTSYYRPIWFGHILSGRAEVGYGFGWGGDELPVFERFYLGGPNSIRSVKFREISPVDSNGVRVGGTSEILGNVEYIVPLPFNLRAAAFFDIGNAYGFDTKFDPTSTREAVGAGMRWLSPFGPIRVDYGINLDRRRGEDFGAFHFSVGSPF